ncbi:uncharacterized protein LOC119012600 isoform X1 [Acanthopagrus latus]|uniref:uncharacterized protein LOC119012600 isoform X1 n=1 Tax=Acanthopagrus latus TaxID=8177 RepID=UPI00187C8B20|nr:uncharacterized protein LOC119012600 isoform X1 [Acanthopagrus latus]
MVELRWIMCPLFLMLEFSLTAVTEKHSFDAVRVGDEVTLSCENAKRDQEKCDNTTWLFTDPTNVMTLFEYGRIHKEAGAKSDRLSVTESCSLVLKKVTVEDGGLYTCRHFQSGVKPGPDTNVDLSVITMTEHEDGEKVTLSCSGFSRGQCNHRMKWLYEGKYVPEGQDMETTQLRCSAAVTFHAADLKMSKHPDVFTCEVTEVSNGKVQRFTFSRQSSGEVTGDEKTAAATSSPMTNESLSTGNEWTSVKMSTSFRTNSTASANHSDGVKQEGWYLFIVVSVGLAVFLMILAAVVRKKRAEGNKLPTDEHMAEDGVLYANLPYARNTNRRQVWGDDGHEVDAATYSTGRASSLSRAASTVPCDSYASVNKPKKKKEVS